MPEKPSLSIKKLFFSGGSIFDLGSDEKIILVGPNNSGKSQSLREIMSVCENGKNDNNAVIVNVEILKKGTEEELRLYLREIGEYINDQYRYQDWTIHDAFLRDWQGHNLNGVLLKGFIKKIAADDRLTICQQQQSVGPNDQKSKPQHVLYDSEALMAKISLLFKRAFGKELMFDYRGGSRLPIHVGDIPFNGENVDRVSDAYVKIVRKNPLLDKQGDGMKSYAGILFEAVVSNKDVTLIDEPEAFLHPPQMRKLGETLSSEVKGQLIVATHSSDILRGFLEGTQGNVRILRIRREADVNLVSEASPLVIKELWEKPVLRYSNALEGIFHEQTIICEDDSDCRLINSMADHISSTSGEQWQDTAYVPTGGKHGVPKVAGVLRKIGVPVKAVFDIDFLAESDLVKSTVEAFGGQWGEIESLWKRLDSAVRKGITPKTVPEIKNDIISLLESADEDVLPKNEIKEMIKQGSAWAEVKKYGTLGLPHGQTQTDYNALRDKLEEIGVFLVPVGEIESFCPEIGLHGPKFVTKLLTEIPLGDSRLQELRGFVEKVHKGQHGRLNE